MKKKQWFLARLHQSVRNINSNKGSTTIILGAMIAVLVIILTLAITVGQYLKEVKRVADDAVVAAGLAALRSELNEDIAYGEYYLDKQAAEDTFLEKLAENLKLDSSLYPLSGSFSTTPVTVESFEVYNPEEIVPDLECPIGTPITKTSIHAVISFRTKVPGLNALLGSEKLVRVHKDVDNHYDISIE